MPKFKKYSYNYDSIYNEDDVSYYLLGAFMSDGCVNLQSQNRRTISLCSKDKDWLEIINSKICKDIPIIKNKSNCYKITFCQSDFVNWFISKGCTSNKSLNIKFPIVPSKYIPDFIRGCWDGDGSITYKYKFRPERNSSEIQRHMSISSGSKEFIESIKNIFDKYQINSKVCIREKSQNIIEGRLVKFNHQYYILNITKKLDMINLVNLIYYKNNKIAMPRKENLAKFLSLDHLKPTTIVNGITIL